MNIMGIVNVTPDSFSDYIRLYDGKGVHNMDAILNLIQHMIDDGADIIDIGGESTRPDASEVSADEELNRVIPVIEAIHQRFDIPISLDTYKALVAKEGIKSGASIINDIGMARKDPLMADVIVSAGCKYILVDNNKYYVNDDMVNNNINYVNDDMVNDNMNYVNDNVVDDNCNYVNKYMSFFYQLQYAAQELMRKGVKKDNIILDPGVGFGKSYEQNLEAIRKMSELCKLGYETLLGVSNKSVIGNTLELPVDERLEGTLATTAWAVMSGVSYVRVHDVKANARLIKMLDAIIRQ